MLSEDRQSTWVGRLVRTISIPSRLKEEILAFLLFIGAVILTLPMVGQTDAALLGSFADVLRATVGRAALAVPMGLAILAVEIWRADDPGDRARGYLAGQCSAWQSSAC
ncbi:MAG: hypothetical protein R3A46_04405 [Thermomicrobiales bacterium]